MKLRNGGLGCLRLSPSSLALMMPLALPGVSFAQAPAGAVTVVTHVDVVPDEAKAGAKLLSKEADAFEEASSSAHTKAFRNAIFPMLGSPFDERPHTELP